MVFRLLLDFWISNNHAIYLKKLIEFLHNFLCVGFLRPDFSRFDPKYKNGNFRTACKDLEK
jgi:hypothetical protein